MESLIPRVHGLLGQVTKRGGVTQYLDMANGAQHDSEEVKPPRLAKLVVGVADVLCDEAGRLGALSYLVPDDLVVRVGDAVEVPFGKRTARGLVLGVGDATKATRPITKVYGPRADEREIALARDVARWNFSTFTTIAPRLAPRTKRGNPPLKAGRVAVAKGESFEDLGRLTEYSEKPRRLYACAPLVDQSRLGALEAAELAREGQVLILCPTKESVGAVLAQFSSGAARMDIAPKTGEASAWKSFLDGSLKVAVATRTAALWAAPHLAGIIVVDESHPGHVEAVMPHTNARDIASLRSERIGAKLILISSNPSPLALGAKAKVLAVGKAEHWPEIEVVVRPSYAKNRPEAPAPVRAALRAARQEGSTPVVVAPAAKAVRICSKCRKARHCAVCEGHSCAHLRGSVCERCGEKDTRLLGWDVARVQSAVGRPARVLGANELHGVHDAKLVVIFDLDPFLEAPGLVPERMASNVIVSACRTAGAGGRLVVVTAEANANVVDDLLVRKDLVRSAKRTWIAAKEAKLPPFGRLVTLRVASASAPRVTGWPGTAWGPRKVGDEYEVLVRCEDSELEELSKHIERLRRRSKVRLSVS